MNESALRKVWDKTSGHCHFCGDPVIFEKRGWQKGDLTGYWEVDHVIQKGKGGKTLSTIVFLLVQDAIVYAGIGLEGKYENYYYLD